MSSKHYFPETAVNTLVPRFLTSLTRANPSLTLIPSYRVVLNSTASRSRVTLISGGGSGHEPAWSGYVGDGLLTAVACGDIFASPSMKQVLAAIAACPSDKGCILLITNYTGDKLHFGLAAEKAMERGWVERGKCVVLPATDDVSIGRSKSQKVGRRGLAGNVITMKILGAAAAKEYSFEQLVKIGKAVNEQLVSIGSALDHCHVPGRQNHEEIGDDVCVVGAGIHNEPAVEKVSPIPSVESLISRLLDLICDQNDTDRAFVKFNKGDDNVLLINNYGGLSPLELGALTEEVLTQLEKNWDIKPTKIYTGPFETSLNGPGFSVTLCNLTTAAKESNTSVDELMDLLGAETKAPAWPNVLANTSTNTAKKDSPEVDIEKQAPVSADEDIQIDPEVLESAIRTACKRAIDAEPNLTKWDMIMGDGDCGEAVRDVSKAIIKIVDDGGAKSGSVQTLLQTMTNAVDDMGGTLGAIFGILLAAFSTSLRAQKSKAASDSKLIDLFAPALAEAVESLKQHTGARVGDRTVMDVLLPFADSLDNSRDLETAVRKAESAAEGTKELKAGFGRASYVGGVEEKEKVPDPGAWALFEIVKGLLEGGKQR
ncbi:related to dihydroxyacetone kinase [Rhynchosporium secalis]|uniref:Related to dihydroxyacetone kinase n=1 Tax=Rhynchosporium secalis TaxID=38038 RepID=A0A1E1MNK9_RHYSE|nr:related to dihydroxyacetone kinase [Rhynchosporium secalis]